MGLIGVAVLAGFEPRLAGRMLMGDLLAVGAAVAFALYSLYGRRERGRIPLLWHSGLSSPRIASLPRPRVA